jgi:hypothetical protein
MDTAKKRRSSISLTRENLALLKWLKFSTNRDYSSVVNSLLDLYRTALTADMTDYEKEQIERLQAPAAETIFTPGELERLAAKGAQNIVQNINLV